MPRLIARGLSQAEFERLKKVPTLVPTKSSGPRNIVDEEPVNKKNVTAAAVETGGLIGLNETWEGKGFLSWPILGFLSPLLRTGVGTLYLHICSSFLIYVSTRCGAYAPAGRYGLYFRIREFTRVLPAVRENLGN